jgi:hypothetical protein
VDIQEGRDVTEIEQTDMAEGDRILVKQIWRNHSQRDRVPYRPEGFPRSNGGYGERVCGSNPVGRFEEREQNRRPLEKPQRVIRGGVHPALDRAKVCICEQREGVLFAELVRS